MPSKDEVTETPEEKMRREYMEILNTGKRLVLKSNLPVKKKNCEMMFTIFLLRQIILTI